MKGLLTFAALAVLSVAPAFAAKSTTVTISQSVTSGSVQIAPGDYKVSYEGSGPAVKVTLSKSGTAPIVLNAKLLPDQKGSGSVLVATENGARVLQEIDLPSGSLVFEASPADQK